MDKNRSDHIVCLLEQNYPDSKCSLDYNCDPWKLLIMGILSAQCKDSTVNTVCNDLFKKYGNCFELGNASLEYVENIIRKCGLYHIKSANIISVSFDIHTKFGGKVPDTVDDLTSLKGVGRKIANLVLGDCFNKPAIVTDTHCIRICGRLGYYDEGEKNAYKIEKILNGFIDADKRSSFCHRLVDHGRAVCDAKKPNCENCFLNKICTFSEKRYERNYSL